ncbi:hypothetical protein LCGC14_1399500 [marine sediment metagenome]|uniref:Lipoprotein n=1 Tax=marine sediment metagenome TaxID=412755 RepID=A0A0F9MD22_9ZZZZ
MRTIILIVLTMFLVGCSISQQDCKDIALKESKEWQDLGYGQGMSRGIDICEEQYKPMLEQYNPPEDCMILLREHTMQFVCKNLIGEEKYNALENGSYMQGKMR